MANENREVTEKDNSFLGGLMSGVSSVVETVSNVADVAGDVATAVGTGISKAAEDVYQTGTNVVSNFVEGVTDTYDTFSKGKTIFESKDKYVSQNKLINSNASMDTLDRIGSKFVDTWWTSPKDAVTRGIDDYFNISDGDYFTTKKDRESAIELINLMGGTTDKERQDNMDKYLPKIKALMKGGMQMTDADLIDKIVKYTDSKKENPKDEQSITERLEKEIKDKVESDLKIKVEGSVGIENIGLVDEFKRGAGEKLVEILSARNEFEVDAQKKGMDSTLVKEQLKKMDDVYETYKERIQSSIKYGQQNKDAFTEKSGELNIYNHFMSGASDSDLNLMNDWARRITKENNILLDTAAMNSVKDGNLFSAAMGLVGNTFNIFDTALDLKTAFSPLAGTDYDRTDRKSMISSLAADNNFISLADKTGMSKFFFSSINNIDDISQGIISPTVFNKVSGINKVVNFLDKQTGKVGHIATGLKSAVEGYAFNRGLSLAANETATDDYTMGNMLMDIPMENFLNGMGALNTKFTGYTGLGQVRKFKDFMIKNIESDTSLATDQVKKNIDAIKEMNVDELKSTIDTFKSVAKNNIDYDLRNSIIKNNDSLFNFAKQVGEEYKNTGGVSYNNTGLIIKDITEGSFRKQNGLDIFSSSKLTINKLTSGSYDGGLTNLDKVNLALLKNETINIKKYEKLINKEDLEPAIQLSRAINSDVKSIDVKNLNINNHSIFKIKAETLKSNIKKLDDILKRNSLDNSSHKITYWDAIDGKQYIIDTNQLNQESDLKVGKVIVGDKQVSLYKYKYEGQDRDKISKLIEGTYVIDRNTNLSSFAVDLANTLGIKAGDILTGEKKVGDTVDAVYKLTESGGKVKLSAINEGEDPLHLLRIKHGAERSDILMALKLSEKFTSRQFEDIDSAANLLKLTLGTLNTNILQILGDNNLLKERFDSMMDSVVTGNIFDTIYKIEGATVDDKQSMIINFVLQAATRINKLNETDSRLIENIMSLADDRLTKAELYTHVLAGDSTFLARHIGEENFLSKLNIEGSMLINLGLELTTNDIANAFKKTSNKSLNNLSLLLIDDLIKNTTNLNKFFIGEVFKSEAYLKISGEKTLINMLMINKNEKEKLIKDLATRFKTLEPNDLVDYSKTIKELEQTIKEGNLSEEKLKELTQDLNNIKELLTLEKQEITFITQKRNELKATDIKDIGNINKFEQDAIDFLKESNLSNSVSDELLKLYKEIINKKLKLLSDKELDLDQILNMEELTKSLIDTINEPESRIYNGWISEDGKVINYGDSPIAKTLSNTLKYNDISLRKDIRLTNKINESIFKNYGTDLNKLKDESFSQTHYDSLLLDTDFGKEVFRLSPAKNTHIVNKTYQRLLKNALAKKSYVEGFEYINNHILSLKRKFLADGNEDILTDVKKYEEQIILLYLKGRYNNVKIEEEEGEIKKIGKYLLSSLKGLGFEDVLGKVIAKGDIKGIIESKAFKLMGVDSNLLNIDKKIQKHIIPKNTLASILLENTGLKDGKVLNKLKEEFWDKDIIELKIPKFDKDPTGMQRQKGSTERNIKQKVQEFLNLSKWRKKKLGALYTLASEKDSEALEKLTDNLSDVFFEGEDAIKSVIDQFLFNKLLDNLPETFFKEIIINSDTTKQKIIDMLDVALKAAPIIEGNKYGKEIISIIDNLKENVETIAQNIKDGYKTIDEKVTPEKTEKDLEEHVEIFNKLFYTFSNPITDIEDKVTNDNLIKYNREIRTKFLNSIKSYNSEVEMQQVVISASGHTTVQIMGETSVNKLKLLGLDKTIDLKNIISGGAGLGKTSLNDLFNIYNKVTIGVYDETFYKDIQRKIKGKVGNSESNIDKVSEEDIRKLYILINNNLYINKITGNNYRTLAWEEKLYDGFNEQQFIALSDYMKSGNFGVDYIGLPNFGEDKKEALITNINRTKIDKIIKELKLETNRTLDNKQIMIILSSIDDHIFGDIKSILGFPSALKDSKDANGNKIEGMDITTFNKRIKQHLTSGNGLVAFDGKITEVLLTTSIYKDLIKEIRKDKREALNKTLGKKTTKEEIEEDERIDTVGSFSGKIESLTQSDSNIVTFTKEDLEYLTKSNGGNIIKISGETKKKEKKIINFLEVKTKIDLFNKKAKYFNKEAFSKVLELFNEVKTFIKDYETDKWNYNNDYIKKLEDLPDTILSILKDKGTPKDIVNEGLIDAIDGEDGMRKMIKNSGIIEDIKSNELLKNDKANIDVSFGDIKIDELNNNILKRGGTNGYEYALKTLLISRDEQFRDILSAGLGIKKQLEVSDLIDLILEKDKKLIGVMQKIYELIETDLFDGMGYVSYGLSKVIYTANTGIKIGKKGVDFKEDGKDYIDEEKYKPHDGKWHIIPEGGLSKIRQMVLTKEETDKIEKVLIEKGIIKEGEHFILSPEGGVKVGKTGFDPKEGDIEVEGRKVGIKGFKEIKFSDIQIAASDAVEHKQTAKLSTQYIRTTSDEFRSPFEKILLDIKEDSLENFEIDTNKLLTNTGSKLLNNAQINEATNGEQDKLLATLKGIDLDGSDNPLSGAGVYYDEKFNKHLTKQDTIYLSPDYYKELKDNGSFFEINGKKYLLTSRNPVPTEYNRSIVEVQVNHKATGYNVTSHPKDILLKKEGDYDGDKITMIFNNTKKKGLLTKLLFFDSLRKTNISHKVDSMDFRGLEGKKLEDRINKEYDNIKEIDGINNEFIFTGQVTKKTKIEKADIDKTARDYYEDTLLKKSVDTLIAKGKVGEVATAIMYFSELDTDIKYFNATGKDRSYNGIVGTFVEQLGLGTITENGLSVFSSILQKTLDFAKSDEPFPEDWLDKMLVGIKGFDDLSEADQRYVTLFIKQLAPEIQKFKTMTKDEFIKYRFDYLPSSMRTLYGRVQDMMRKLETLKVDESEMFAAYKKTIIDTYRGEDINIRKEEEGKSRSKLVEDLFTNGYLNYDDKQSLIKNLNLPAINALSELKKLSELNEGESIVIKKYRSDTNKEESEDMAKLLDLLKINNRDRGSYVKYEGLEISHLGDYIEVRINKYDFKDKNTYLKIQGETYDKLVLNESMPGEKKLDYAVAFYADGKKDIFGLMTNKDKAIYQIVSMIKYGTKGGVNRMKEMAKKFKESGLNNLSEKILELVKKTGEEDGGNKFLKEILGEDWKNKIDVNLINSNNKIIVEVQKQSEYKKALRKVTDAYNMENIETDILYSLKEAKESGEVYATYEYKDGKLLVRKKETYSLDNMFNTTGIYSHLYKNQNYRDAVLLGVYGLQPGSMNHMLDNMSKMESMMQDVTSITMETKFNRYMPDVYKRIHEVRDLQRAKLQGLFLDITKVKNKYKESFKGATNLQHRIDNKIFIAALESGDAEDVAKRLHIDDLKEITDELRTDAKEYAKEVSSLFAKRIFELSREVKLDKINFKENSASSYIMDFAELGVQGHKIILDELGISSYSTMKDYLRKVTPGISEREITTLTNSMLGLGNGGNFIGIIKRIKSEAFGHKYGFIGMITGYSLATTLLQMIPDFFKMISKKSPSFTDPRLNQYIMNNKMLDSEILRAGDIIFEDSGGALINKPIQGLTEVVKTYLPGVTLKNTASMVSSIMQNPLQINEIILGSARRKIAVASAFDMFAKNMGMSQDNMWNMYNGLDVLGRKKFDGMIRSLAHNNLMNMTGGASTLGIAQETILSKGWHNAYTFLQGWATHMTNSHVEGVSNLFSATRYMFTSGDKRKVHFNKFMDYLYGNLNTTIIAMAAVAKYNMYFNNNLNEDGEYDYFSYIKDLNNSITGLNSFAGVSALNNIIDKYDGENNSYMANVVMMTKEILSKFGTETILLKNVVGFVTKGIKEGLNQEDMLNGITDIYRNNLTGFLRYNRFEDNDGWYADHYTNNMFAIAMGVNDKTSMEDLNDDLKTMGAITKLGVSSPYGLMQSLLGASGYMQTLKQIYDPESFKVLEMQYSKIQSIRDNDTYLKQMMHKGIDPLMLEKIMAKDGKIDKLYTKELFETLTSYSSKGSYDFIETEDGTSSYQKTKGGIVDAITVSKLESKYGKEFTQAIISGSRDDIVKNVKNLIQEKVGGELLKTIQDIEVTDTDKYRKQLLVVADKSGITIPTMISVLMYDNYRNLSKKMTEEKAQYLSVKKYGALMNLSLPAVNDVGNIYIGKFYKEELNSVLTPKNGVNQLKKSLENKVLTDMLVARSYYEDGDTNINLLRSNYAGLFNSSYEEIKASGFKKQDLRRLIGDYIRTDTMLDGLIGKVDGNKLMMYKEAAFSSMLNKPEILAELTDTENKIFDKSRDNLIHRLFKFKADTVGFDMDKLEDIVKKDYLRNIGVSSFGGSGKGSKGSFNPQQKGFRSSGQQDNAKQLMPRLLDKGMDLNRAPKNLYRDANPLAVGGYNAAPTLYTDSLKYYTRRDSKDYFDQMSKDMFKKSPGYINKVFGARRMRAENIKQSKEISIKDKGQARLTKAMIQGNLYSRK